MVLSLIQKIVGSRNDREIKRLQAYVDEINQLESSIQKLSDAQLKAKATEFKERLNSLEFVF